MIFEDSSGSDYDISHKRIIRNRVKGFIVLVREINDPEILVVKECYGQYGLPGGSKDKRDATPLDCAKREFREEVGLSLPKTNFLECSVFRYKRIIYNMYTTTTEASIPEFSKSYGEIRGLRWIKLSNVTKPHVLAKFRPCFQIYMKVLIQVIKHTICTKCLLELDNLRI